jgi:hypothetical protein
MDEWEDYFKERNGKDVKGASVFCFGCVQAFAGKVIWTGKQQPRQPTSTTLDCFFSSLCNYAIVNNRTSRNNSQYKVRGVFRLRDVNIVVFSRAYSTVNRVSSRKYVCLKMVV